MSGFSVNTNEHLIRSNIWTPQIKEVFEDELFAAKYVDMVTDFPDGDTWNMPSVGQMEVRDYAEGQAVQYTAMDTGNFTLTITEYKTSATYVTNRNKQDSFYMGRLVSTFPQRQSRALMKAFEVDVLEIAQLGQTANNPNAINGADHRFVASGGSNGARTVDVKDFAKAWYSLDAAEVPPANRVAIVDPSVEYTLNTLTNIANVSNNPRWEGLISSGMSTGMRFIKNIYGFDVYTSPNLYKKGSAETITDSGSVARNTGSAPVSSIFFSATPEALPFIGAMRQSPTVESEYKKDLQRDEYLTIMRYGVKLLRPEGVVTVFSDIVIS